MNKPAQHLKCAICIAMLMVAGGLFTGCAAVGYRAPVMPPPGLIYAEIKAPLTTNVKGNALAPNLKKASSKKTQFFNWPYPNLAFGWGESDIASIAKQGGINEVVYADYELLNIVGIYAEFTVNVYGK